MCSLWPALVQEVVQAFLWNKSLVTAGDRHRGRKQVDTALLSLLLACLCDACPLPTARGLTGPAGLRTSPAAPAGTQGPCIPWKPVRFLIMFPFVPFLNRVSFECEVTLMDSCNLEHLWITWPAHLHFFQLGEVYLFQPPHAFLPLVCPSLLAGAGQASSLLRGEIASCSSQPIRHMWDKKHYYINTHKMSEYSPSLALKWQQTNMEMNAHLGR